MPLIRSKRCKKIYDHYHSKCQELTAILERKDRTTLRELRDVIRTLRQQLRTIDMEYKKLSTYQHLMHLRQVLRPCYFGRVKYHRLCVDDQNTMGDIYHNYARRQFAKQWLLSQRLFQKCADYIQLSKMTESQVEDIAPPTSEQSAEAKSDQRPVATARRVKHKAKKPHHKESKGNDSKENDMEFLNDQIAQVRIETNALDNEKRIAEELMQLSQEEVFDILERLDPAASKNVVFKSGRVEWSFYSNAKLTIHGFRDLLYSCQLSDALVVGTLDVYASLNLTLRKLDALNKAVVQMFSTLTAPMFLLYETSGSANAFIDILILQLRNVLDRCDYNYDKYLERSIFARAMITDMHAVIGQVFIMNIKVGRCMIENFATEIDQSSVNAACMIIRIEAQRSQMYISKSPDEIQRCAYRIIFELQRSTRDVTDIRGHLPYFDSAVPDPSDMADVLIDVTKTAMSNEIPMSMVRSTVDIILTQKRCSASQINSESDTDVTVMRIVSADYSFVTCPCEFLAPQNDTEKLTLLIPDHFQAAIERSSGIWLPQISPAFLRKVGSRQVFVTVSDSANNYIIHYNPYIEQGSTVTTYTGHTVDLQEMLRQQMMHRRLQR